MQGYPGLDRGTVVRLLAEREAANRYEYEAFTDFRLRPFRGEFINVSEHGFRLVRGQRPWPPEGPRPTVFVFGGSTAYGDRLPDAQTIPSLLQDALTPQPGAAIFNFARPGYFSSQERILFEQLAVSGFRPDVAVFFDGLNEFSIWDPPGSTFLWSSGTSARTRQVLSQEDDSATLHDLQKLARDLPLTRVLLPRQPVRRDAPGPERRAQELRRLLARYQENVSAIEAVSARWGIHDLFVIQPTPVHHYESPTHFAGRERGDELGLVSDGYGLLEEARRGGSLGPHSLWLADVQTGRHEELYVDSVHYTASFSREIAERIAKELAPVLSSSTARSAAGR
ncbi:MAG TPA: SGNH/GDSL hydrolase family protein [Thermoanaerobaculia bacterium]|nr:SGNH/GDSL hydrolase family protein [Thermoanaerobaculia bacterium]